MKIACEVARDLMPLYVEGIASEESGALMEEHLGACAPCREELEKMRAPQNAPADSDVRPLQRIRADLRKQKRLTILFSVLLSLFIAAIVVGYLTSPEYIPYVIDRTVTVTGDDGGTLFATFSNGVTGYDINRYHAEDGSGLIIHITAWDSVWNRLTAKRNVDNIVLNPDGGPVTSVYYYRTDGGKDILIYGADQAPDGGIFTLPRLFLGYYFLLALVCAAVCGLLLLLFRKKEKARSVLTKILVLPVAYLLSHLCVKGFTSATYSGMHDFFTILIAAVPLYAALLLGAHLLKARTRRRAAKDPAAP